MRIELVKVGVKVLMELFYGEEKKTEDLGLATMELLHEMKLFNDRGQVAFVIEQMDADMLLQKLELLDVPMVREIQERMGED